MKNFLTLGVISILTISLLGAGCRSNDSYEYSSQAGGNKYEEVEPENPYSSGSGHSAGYEWAERTGGSCGGSSASFNEGCEEYYSQLEGE